LLEKANDKLKGLFNWGEYPSLKVGITYKFVSGFKGLSHLIENRDYELLSLKMR
jgi:hypothetical protein